MPRYFFDIVDGGAARDDIGTECASMADVRRTAMRTLPEIARDELSGETDRRYFTVIARDENRHAIYTATLGYAGTWLDDPAYNEPVSSR